MTSEALIEPIRSTSRQLVRELGFMGKTLAGTQHPPSAIHTLIEMGDGKAKTATQLCKTLKLEEFTAEQTLDDLLVTGEVENTNATPNRAERIFLLSPKGEQSLADINLFVRAQVSQALSYLDDREARSVLLGLETYVASLRAQKVGKINTPTSSVKIVRGYTPGLIGRALEMHLSFYSQVVGFGAYFESELATGLADVVSRMDDDKNEAWTARADGRIVGTVFIDGEGLGQNRAHLRAFIVDSDIRSGGIGLRLLAEAVEFVDKERFAETHLWTFQGLEAARRLCESYGFILKEQSTGNRWGKEVPEQLFVRKRLRI